MKHFYNILKILFLFCIDLFFKAIGFLILPVAVLFIDKIDNKEKFKCKWIDFIYGNKYDGFGDTYYKRDYSIDTYWSRLNWCMLRNPTHNLGLYMGCENKRIVKSFIYGNPNVTDDPFIENMGLKFQECYDDEDIYYPMYYCCIMWKQFIPFYKGNRGFRLLMGYKNFCVKELNQYYTYGFVCTITPFKLFVKG